MYTLASLFVFLLYVGIITAAVPLALYVITPRVMRRRTKGN